jgi:hypothetical protein
MQKFNISDEFISSCNEALPLELPKYTSQLINLANQNAHGTRPKVVGQLSELFPEYLNSVLDPTKEGWEKWYLENYPIAMDTAVEKINGQIENLKNALPLVTKEMIKSWVSDLIINKTFNGLYFQKAILQAVAKKENTTFRLANPSEESQGIDGYIGDMPVSIKPDTYEMNRLSEEIDVKIIYYTKKKSGITVKYE